MLEEDDVEWLKQVEKDNPSKVMHYNCTSIEWFFFGDKQVVVMCPCKEDIKIHNMLLNNEYSIIKFFKEKLKQEKKLIKYEEKQLKDL